jgi:hypothetical protein
MRSLPHPIPLNRSAAWRAVDSLFDTGALVLDLAHAARAHWRAGRRLAAAHAALRELHPRLLRDIGASHELMAEAESRRAVNRAQLERLLRGD